jgi:diacylglycerol kinase
VRTLKKPMDSMKRTLMQGVRYALAGWRYTLRTQWAASIHLSAAIIVIVVGIVLHLKAAEWAIILLVIGLVFVAEMLNSGMEALVDLATQEYHPLARRAKDVAAGAVLAAAITSIVIGLLVLGPPLLTLLGWKP